MHRNRLMRGQYNSVSWITSPISAGPHNGYYYANQYESYPYWNEELSFAEFHQANRHNLRTYRITWDGCDATSLTQPALHTLRYMSQRTKLRLDDFTQLSGQLDDIANLYKNGPYTAILLRLLVACITLGDDRVSNLKTADLKRVFSALNANNKKVLSVLNWLSDQLLLDGDITSGILKLRWEDLDRFVEIIGEIGVERLPAYLLMGTSIPNSGRSLMLEFLNACGRALQCDRYFAKKQEFSFSIEHLIKSIFNPDINNDISSKRYSILRNYPWITDVTRLEDSEFYNTLRSHPYEQINLLMQQLRSIDYAASHFLPNSEEISNVLTLIARCKESNLARQTRITIVKDWQSRGCAITYVDSNFQKLNSEQMRFAMAFMDKQLRLNFKDENIKLCEKLKAHLAVKVGKAEDKQIEALMIVLLQIDNKSYYNELGPIIGLLLSKAKSDKGEARCYSIPQLTSWLKLLSNTIKSEIQHYPVNLLEEILTYDVDKGGFGLIHHDLYKLEETSSNAAVQKLIRDITNTTLPNDCQSALLKCYLRATLPSELDFIQNSVSTISDLCNKKYSQQFIIAVSDFVQNNHLKTDEKKAVWNDGLNNPLGLEYADKLKDLYNHTRLNLINKINGQILPASDYVKHLKPLVTNKSANNHCIYIILTHAMKGDWRKEKEIIESVKAKLSRWQNDELLELAYYYATEPRPSMQLLDKMLSKASCNSAKKLIHQFETIEQDLTVDQLSKRHYSVTDEDRDNLIRLLSGFKRKGTGHIKEMEVNELINLLYYANNFSQIARLKSVSIEDLKNELMRAVAEFKTAQSIDVKLQTLFKDAKNQTSARILACLREILLRKSGKWANHTQMLTLLYAAIHNDDGLLYQVMTGQGKSIITIMRTSYMELSGFVVDVFSAKDSLSERDHEEFEAVLSVIEVPHSYINHTSVANSYHAGSESGNIGAGNYSTVGNFSLFQSTLAWQKTRGIDLDRSKRVAFVDEADHVLNIDQTQFNYSAQSGDAVYNFDEWVYRIAYDFYLSNKDSFIHDKSGTILVSRNKHLKALCDLLQKHVRYAPKQSRFFDKYIIPALSNDKVRLDRRDQQLMQLLTASHIAHGLLEGANFSIRPVTKKIAGMEIKIRSAKVLIGNQIQPNSTYSEYVHQFLHVRLNKEAVEKGQAPDFFVEPISHIAISLNTRYILNEYYCKIEGCSGTVGNSANIDAYREHYSIEHVIKIPSHEQSQSVMQETYYAESAQDQINKIVDIYINNPHQPILITCRDDIAVKRITEQVKKELKNRNIPLDKLITDTNDSGKQESEMLLPAGQEGARTFSSRMGRGTDIKLACKDGLKVVRTYPALSETEKQERGRQGRNGARGTCQDVIDYSEIERMYYRFNNGLHSQRLQEIYKHQTDVLHRKLEKGKDLKLFKWRWLADNVSLQEKYLKTSDLHVAGT